MIDHIYLPVTDLTRSDTFYRGMLGPLGMSERWHFKAQAGYPDLTGFGEPGIPGFWLKASKTTCAELYVAFAAKNEAAVNKAFEAALANGGKDNGEPGLRPQFDPRYYAANVLDPNGLALRIKSALRTLRVRARTRRIGVSPRLGSCAASRFAARLCSVVSCSMLT